MIVNENHPVHSLPAPVRYGLLAVLAEAAKAIPLGQTEGAAYSDWTLRHAGAELAYPAAKAAWEEKEAELVSADPAWGQVSERWIADYNVLDNDIQDEITTWGSGPKWCVCLAAAYAAAHRRIAWYGTG